MDLYDLANFYKFFKDLYSKKTLTADTVLDLKDAYNIASTQGNITLESLSEVLNADITESELLACIKKLKNGKAIAEDCVLNEFLKSASLMLRKAILKLFNECLEHGVYPWNTALITPLHKKGDKYDPNNYRAIAVGSNLGKLFSSILLERMIAFRNERCPDPINQLGFCKGGQTSDHILTMNTCIQKYLGKKEYMYACFIDYQKAFDTVCREALLYKLYNLGINGRFFECLKNMYSNSKAKIKLLNKVSDTIDVLIGTEQGHPMSPELFKCFLLELSGNLDNIPGVKSPVLSNKQITHLLWADDLVLLALDAASLQTLLNEVFNYCTLWGLTVNLEKTAVLVFNKSGRQLKASFGFKYGKSIIDSAKKYCYLGIMFSLSGSMKQAQNELRLKGLKAYFALTRSIDIRSLNTRSLFRLFDALVVPVFTYGCQVWFHESNFIKLLTTRSLFQDCRTSMTKISTDETEKIHLKFIKWSLGLSAKASNMVCWGDTDRTPIAIQVTKQVLGYIKRLEHISGNPEDERDPLVKYAYREQMELSLPWYKSVKELKSVLQHETLNPQAAKTEMETTFKNLWKSALKEYKKLTFYREVKRQMSYEPYLDIKSYSEKRVIAKLRASNNRLNCEPSRYILYTNGKLSNVSDS